MKSVGRVVRTGPCIAAMALVGMVMLALVAGSSAAGSPVAGRSVAGRSAAGSSAAGSSAAGSSAAGSLTSARLAYLLRQGVRVRRVPANLSPPLAEAGSDVSIPWRRGCLVSGSATTNGQNCAFGDLQSSTTVVLLGDSHAAAMFPGINAVSQEQHWRLIFMGKVGCPYADVRLRIVDPYTTCVTWRHNAERDIAALHPAMVIVTSGDYVGSAQPLSGGPSSNRKASWLGGLRATFKTLRRDARHVVFIADVPRMKETTYKCVQAHVSNVYPCTRPRRGAFLWPDVRKQEFTIARQLGVTRVDPASWFCTTTRCPVIANHTLLFRDTQHITPQWAAFLAPMLARKIVPAMTARRG